MIELEGTVRDGHRSPANRRRAEGERLLDDQHLSDSPHFHRNLSRNTGFRYLQNRNVLLNDSIRSVRSNSSFHSEDGDENSLEEGIIREDGIVYSTEPLNNHKSLLPNIAIAELLRGLYDYCRYGAAGVLFGYSIYLMFNKTGGCNQGIQGVKRIPADARNLAVI